MDYWGGIIDVNGYDYYEDIFDANLEDGECPIQGLKGRHFTLPDYIVFGIMFLITISIGVFYGCIKSKQKTASEYLMGNRQMHYLPVALSTTSSLLSAVSILGNPAEMYNYGSQLYLFCLAFMLSGPLTVNLFLPVYENLKITSVYEAAMDHHLGMFSDCKTRENLKYLNLRFHSSVRILYSCCFLLLGLVFNALAIYAPALALAQVTHLRVYVVIIITFCVCVFYGSLGGVKAIIWSDSLQIIIMIFALLALLIRGTILAGGADVIWYDSLSTGRLELFNFDPDPTIRETFWSVFVGGTVYWTSMCATNQNTIQRLLSLPSIRDANKAILISIVGKIIAYTMLFYIGMLIYSMYKDCDPMSSKMVARNDQLLPLYLMDVLGKYPGVPGLLVASIFCTSIGSVATMLSGMTAVTIRDFVQGTFGKKLSETEAGTLSKCLCLGYGIVSIGFVFVVSNVGGILQASFSLTGIVGGLGLGAFTLGLFLPWSNWKGAIGGTICGFAVMVWITSGTIVATKHGYNSSEKKPISIDGCLCNATLDIQHESTEEVFLLYKVSYLWYTSIGMIVSVITGMIISGLTGFQDPRDMDQALISPLAQWFFNKLPLNVRNYLNLPLYEKTTKDDSCSDEDISPLDNIDFNKSNVDMEEVEKANEIIFVY